MARITKINLDAWKIPVSSIGNILVSMYSYIAVQMEYSVDEVGQFDCRKINVTHKVQDVIYENSSAYNRENGNADDVINYMVWANSGPKACIDEDKMIAVIETGFIIPQKKETREI